VRRGIVSMSDICNCSKIDLLRGNRFLQSDCWATVASVPSSAFLNRSISVVRRAGKQDEILIRIRDHKSSGSPRLLLKRLMEGNSRSLITQK
jgi:hypothetical protein